MVLYNRQLGTQFIKFTKHFINEVSKVLDQNGDLFKNLWSL